MSRAPFRDDVASFDHHGACKNGLGRDSEATLGERPGEDRAGGMGAMLVRIPRRVSTDLAPVEIELDEMADRTGECRMAAVDSGIDVPHDHALATIPLLPKLGCADAIDTPAQVPGWISGRHLHRAHEAWHLGPPDRLYLRRLAKRGQALLIDIAERKAEERVDAHSWWRRCVGDPNQADGRFQGKTVTTLGREHRPFGRWAGNRRIEKVPDEVCLVDRAGRGAGVQNDYHLGVAVEGDRVFKSVGHDILRFMRDGNLRSKSGARTRVTGAGSLSRSKRRRRATHRQSPDRGWQAH